MIKKKMVAVLFALMSAGSIYADEIYLSDLDVSKCIQGWGKPAKDASVDGNKITIAGKEYTKGFGTHADSEMYITLDGKVKKFIANVGVDSEIGKDQGSVNFMVYADNKLVFETGKMVKTDSARSIEVNLDGVKSLILSVSGLGDISYDHADWAEAKFVYSGEKPVITGAPVEEKYILTPSAPAEPRINSASVFGVRPGSPILYTVAATGNKPIKFSAEGLPEGVTLDSKNGQIRGQADRGSYKVKVSAKNKLGTDTMILTLEVGDRIALTPPMGWNSWNCWGCAIDEQKIRDSAEWMVKSGLIDYGWQYVNIDDCWMRNANIEDKDLGGIVRDEDGYIATNGNFPDMRGLTDYIHSLGLKTGIYISPGPWTCQGYEGSYKHEKQDAEIFALWGVDYLKYDWCGYNSIVDGGKADLVDLKLPYVFMAWYLEQQDRDIVYSLCQYGMGNVWEWGGEVGGNCWRTTGDITDTWGSMSGIGFAQDECSPFARPGNFNDPDMLVVGKVGWGPNLHDTRLTPNEQYTHISLWSLLASPMLIGCDLSQMDDFTLNLLTNTEVNAVNQDPLVKQAVPVSRKDGCEVWSRPLADGSIAVGLFNRNFGECEVTADFADLGIDGTYTVRDLWRQKDLGKFSKSFSANVPRHGVVFVKMNK